MKTLTKLLLCAAFLCFLPNCQKDEKPAEHFDPNQAVAFTADFDVWDFSGSPTKMAEENGGGCLRTWIGQGTSLFFGDFSVEITLTCFIQPGEICGNFCDLTGTLTTIPEGNTLTFSILKGMVCCNPGPNSDEFQTCFNDLATITGGTGIFARARGSLYPHAFIHNGAPDQWHAKFESEGNIWFYNHYYSNSENPPTGYEDF